MEFDPLKKYDNTQKLYKEVKAWMEKKNVNPEMPMPIVTVYINKCIKHFKNKKKPRVKVLYLCLKYLDEIQYPR